MIDVILETLLDALKMTPILFLAYLFMEFLELKSGEKLNKTVAKVGYAGPLLGSILGNTTLSQKDIMARGTTAVPTAYLSLKTS